MVEKLHEYQGYMGRIHTLRDSIRGSWTTWKDEHCEGHSPFSSHTIKNLFHPENHANAPPQLEDDDRNIAEKYSDLYRRKTRKELIRVSAAVMGIEFSYAAETAFVSPTLLKIGVKHQHMTLVWALSPLVGFFLTPILGSLSDRCRLRFGRRRPFILLLALGVFIGLILVPNGENMGYGMGDRRMSNITEEEFEDIDNETHSVLKYPLAHRTSASKIELNVDEWEDIPERNITVKLTPPNSHPWGVFFTVLGTVLLDFDADACQSPARAYLLDVTIPEDHARGLSTFTIMAGLGGFMGYALGGVNWDVTALGILLGGHVKAVFSLITVIFVFCVLYTVTSFKEIPLALLEKEQSLYLRGENSEPSQQGEASKETTFMIDNPQQASTVNYGAVDNEDDDEKVEKGEEFHMDSVKPEEGHDEVASLKEYLRSIIIMPWSLRILCLTNLFCWMAHVCYSLYFTDFVGEAVFGGDPKAPPGSESHELYEAGVRFGCWGMSMYSLSCACYSFIIERLIKRFRARPVYVGGLLVYCTGMFLMAVTKHQVGVILFSWSAGVMYSTLFTMPYLLIAHYHACGTFEITPSGEGRMGSQIRGLGTDIAIVSSMVFLAQFILSMCMGSIVTYSGTTTAVVAVASALSFFGAIAATQVMYLDL